MRKKGKVTTKIFKQKRSDPVLKKQNTGVSKSIGSPIANLVFLQKNIGNQAVQKLFEYGAIQAKLKIGQPGDKYEQGADRVANQVMNMSESYLQRQVEPEEEEEESLQPSPLAEQITPLVQRQVEEEEEEPVQPKIADESQVQRQEEEPEEEEEEPA